MSLVRLDSVTKAYHSHLVLDGISLAIEAGERISILGPSGCGKTTILRLMAGFTPPDSGSVFLEGDLVSRDGKILKPPEQRNLGMVFQDLALWPHLTVKENLEFGLKAKAVPRPERERMIRKILKLVGMDDLQDRKPAELSGGQQQRVALARALVPEPGILLMDEPLSSLDLELNIRLRDEILQLHNKLGFTLVYITHDREEAFALANRVIIMNQKQIALTGSVEDVKKYYRTTEFSSKTEQG